MPEGEKGFFSYVFLYIGLLWPFVTILIWSWQLVHCGCIASKCLYEYMDFGGVVCQSCSKHLEIRPMPAIQVIAHSSLNNATTALLLEM